MEMVDIDVLMKKDLSLKFHQVRQADQLVLHASSELVFSDHSRARQGFRQ